MIERLPETQNWFNYIFLILFVLIVILKEINTNKFIAFLKLGWSDVYIKEISNSPKKDYSYISVLLLFFVLSTLIVFQIFGDSFQIKIFEVLFQSKHASVILFSILILKYFLQAFVGYVFNFQYVIKRYLKLKFNLLYYFSIISFIPLLYMYYAGFSEAFKHFYFGIICFFYVVRIIAFYSKFRNLISGNLYYFILYICTFEIVPLLLLIWYVK